MITIKLDEQNIIKLYQKDKYTLRRIAKIYNTDHHRIKRILLKNNIQLDNKNRKREPLPAECREKISKRMKGRPCWCKGKTMPKIAVYKNMLTHLHWNVNLDFLLQFDIEKLKELNHMLAKDRVSIHFDDKKYKEFIEHFYYDKNFNKQYEIYCKTKDRYDRPSLDHIIPLSRGGTWELNNLQIISWFENRAKCDLTQEEFENKIKQYFLNNERK